MTCYSSLPWCGVQTIMGFRMGMVNMEMLRRIADTILKSSLEFSLWHERLLPKIATSNCVIIAAHPTFFSVNN
jgi:hypothetical protein